MFIVPWVEWWEFRNKRTCGLMVTSRGRMVAELPASESSDSDFQSKLWNVYEGELDLKATLPFVPCPLENLARFDCQAMRFA
jgi:hypothetical protein